MFLQLHHVSIVVFYLNTFFVVVVIVVDFSFSKMEEKGFDKCKFIITHKSFRLNIDKYLNYNKDHTISVEVMNENGKLEIKKIPVSENYRKSILQMKF